MAWQLVVYNCDGTLVHTQHALVQAMVEAFEVLRLGVPRDEVIRRRVGDPLVDVVREILPADATVDVADVVPIYRDLLISIRLVKDYRDPLFPGAKDALEALHARGVPLGIATSMTRVELEASLAGRGLRDLFATVQTVDDHPDKPAPDMLRAAMTAVGAAPEATVMVGDGMPDIAMARAAGTRSIGVSWGWHYPDELAGAGADAVVHTFDELTAALDDLTPPTA